GCRARGSPTGSGSPILPFSSRPLNPQTGVDGNCKPSLAATSSQPTDTSPLGTTPRRPAGWDGVPGAPQAKARGEGTRGRSEPSPVDLSVLGRLTGRAARGRSSPPAPRRTSHDAPDTTGSSWRGRSRSRGPVAIPARHGPGSRRWRTVDRALDGRAQTPSTLRTG